MVFSRIAAGILTLLCGASGLNAQEAPFLQPSDVTFIDKELLPVRLELKETTISETGEALDAWVYFSADKTHSWDRPLYQLFWNGMTWNGTGIDIVLADADTMQARARVTPSDVPFGFYVESLYYDGVARRVMAHPDQDEFAITQEADWAPKSVGIPGGGAYNFIIWPFLFSRMDWSKTPSVILPGHSSYAMDIFYFRAEYIGETTYTDAAGNSRDGFEIRARRFKSLEEAQENEGGPGREYFFYLTPEPPYILGFGNEPVDDAGGNKKLWRLSGYQMIAPSSADRFDEIFQQRQRRLQANPQDIPWHQ